MAKRGFYSYDKVNINDNEDYNFELISKPIYHKRLIVNNEVELGEISSKSSFDYEIEFTKAKQDFPENFESFSLLEYV